MSSSSSIRQSIEELQKYSACDISDALLALETTPPGQRRAAGFLSDLVHVNPSWSKSAALYVLPEPRTLIAPAFTVQFSPISTQSESTILPGTQWSDLALQDSIVVIEQPPDQKCAVIGGIHMQRLITLGIRALVVDGRVRDIGQLRSMGSNIPVYAKGTSTVGASAESRATATQVPVSVSGVCVEAGDLVCVDEVEGAVVRIPRRLVGGVLDWLARRGDAEDRILEMIREGRSVADAFEKYR